jgi:hypothetical protein
VRRVGDFWRKPHQIKGLGGSPISYRSESSWYTILRKESNDLRAVLREKRDRNCHA